MSEQRTSEKVVIEATWCEMEYLPRCDRYPSCDCGEELDCDRSRCYASTMAKTDAERKAAERARRREQGLKPFEVWLRPSEWPLVQSYIKRLRARRPL